MGQNASVEVQTGMGSRQANTASMWGGGGEENDVAYFSHSYFDGGGRRKGR
jgi:hypothetical protein